MNNIIGNMNLSHSNSTDSEVASRHHGYSSRPNYSPKGYKKVKKASMNIQGDTRPYKFETDKDELFQPSSKKKKRVVKNSIFDPVADNASQLDQTINSMTYEVDLSAFSPQNALNKSMDNFQVKTRIKKSANANTGAYKSNRKIGKRVGMKQLKTSLKNSRMGNFRSNDDDQSSVTNSVTHDPLRSSILSRGTSKHNRSMISQSNRVKKGTAAKNLPKFKKIYYTDKLIEALANKDKTNVFYEHFL
jgi:hypothetical protein